MCKHRLVFKTALANQFRSKGTWWLGADAGGWWGGWWNPTSVGGACGWERVGRFDAWCPDRADSRADPSVNES